MKICHILCCFAQSLACFALVTAGCARLDHSSSSATSACPCARATLQEVRQKVSQALTAHNITFDTGLILLGRCRQMYPFKDFSRPCVQRYAVDIDMSRKPEFLLKMGCDEPNPDLVPQPGLYYCEPDSTRVQQTVWPPCNTHHEPTHESQVLADTCKLVKIPIRERRLYADASDTAVRQVSHQRIRRRQRQKRKRRQLIKNFFRLVSQILRL